jgi:hypothetical protein
MAEAIEESGVVESVVAEPIDGGSEVPEAPPMSREFLYRDVYDSIDQAQKGHISQVSASVLCCVYVLIQIASLWFIHTMPYDPSPPLPSLLSNAISFYY